LRGRAFLIRYADDSVIGFACEKDARRVLEVLPKRFGKCGLTLHPDKTRLAPFQRPATQPPSNPSDRDRRPGTFDLLGFTDYWGRSRKGVWVVKRKTAQGRLSREPITEQQRTLSQKVRGHCAYYGITGNSLLLQRFRHAVLRLWRKWLGR